MDGLTNMLHEIPFTILLPVIFILAVGVLILTTYVYTRVRYALELPHHTNAAPSSKPQPPPAIPYALPFLGNSLDFLAPKPGQFWRTLFSTHPRSTGACTLLLGGQRTHILFDPTAVQALFKARGPARDEFNAQIMRNSFGIPHGEVNKMYGISENAKLNAKGKLLGGKERQHEISQEHLIKTEAVNELTRGFTCRLRSFFDADEQFDGGKTIETGIVEWLRAPMFKASTTALMGSRLLEVYPQLTDDFWVYDRAMLPLLLGIPTMFTPKEKKALDTVIAGLSRWHSAMQEECKRTPVDPHGDVSWEPVFGSRVNRARQLHYDEQGLKLESKAGCDLGFLFALSSNAIPSAGWMLMHLCDPKADPKVMPRLMRELETAKTADGKLDISVLVGLPLLQSIFHETLRLYTDVLVTRNLKEDLVLPFNNGQRQMVFNKGSAIMAPSFLGHHDDVSWTDPPSETFYADRFLRTDPETGKDVFTLTGTNGKLFPFGGGKTICPGRVFAKQEVLGAVAMTLTQFEIEPLGYLGLNGKPAEKFPGLRDGMGGAGVLAMDGDVKVRMRRRS